MAHFAELDENDIVLRVIVVSNDDIKDANGVERESIGIAFCQRLLGGNWIQTSYNHNFRKRYAGPGLKYDRQRDAFIFPQPFPSWLFNETSLDWEAPVPKPTDEGQLTENNERIGYVWNESILNWEQILSAASPGTEPVSGYPVNP